MPNWVFNGLAVTGDNDKLEEFKNVIGKPLKLPDGSTVQKPIFSFLNIFYPDSSIDYNKEAWSSWNISYWGCKWDVRASDEGFQSTELQQEDELLLYRFQSPWSPPIIGIQRLAQIYPHLEFNLEYEEENGWGGEVTYRDGIEAYSRQWDEPASHADFAAHPYRECYCLNHPYDEEFRFEDCPKVEVGV